MHALRLYAGMLLLAAAPVVAQAQQATTPQSQASQKASWPEAWFEIFRLAPGQHEAFVRRIALADEAARAGGQPPLKLYFHEHGAEWDVLILKHVGESNPTPEQEAAIAAKSKELGIPTGPAYFADLRTTIASHSDTKTLGPISAAQWLAELERLRVDNPDPYKFGKNARKK